MRVNSQELVTPASQEAIQEATTACEQLLSKKNEKLQPQLATASIVTPEVNPTDAVVVTAVASEKINPVAVTSVPVATSSSQQLAQLVVEAVGKVLQTEPDREVERKMSSTAEDKRELLTSGDAFPGDSQSKASEQPIPEELIVARTEEEVMENAQPQEMQLTLIGKN
ncbi:hypothetical protein R1sor_016662 [Riccia sorocarpa]|uniref:Uncharacterized protein n=1 Tax=Riccia sorocarpa TaxID=122646 RepID=A0ABD3HG44_9MARC